MRESQAIFLHPNRYDGFREPTISIGSEHQARA